MSERLPILTIAEVLKGAARLLRGAGVAEARREAGSLLAHTLGRDRAYLFTHDDEALAPEKLSLFRSLVERRASGEPLQYVTGRQEFYGLDFEVTPDVLIPRPETELLIETALASLGGHASPLVCDVGTGSGCIPVALLHERVDARALALDISPAALRVASRNAGRHGVASRFTPLVSDCFDVLRAGVWKETRFRLIVSNPPYIAEREIESLQREVRDHEPRVALTPGGDGLRVIRRLVSEAPDFLEARGHLIFEIGFNQHEQVAALIDPRVWTLLEIQPDLQGIPRIVTLRHKE
ncbi:MAG: peptide chain release factor N(5)-glutamine methyltransferase [Acidobacteria bacterium]|nr:peptide chain release factor N(5)-glutamine methyltransferase [Acidobacteriota bacterium]